MPHSPSVTRVLLALFATAWSMGFGEPWARAQEDAEPSPAVELQTTLERWVLTKQLISQEKAKWQEQKKTWQGLNEIRKIEQEQLEEFAETARSRIPEITEKKEQFATEEKNLRDWRKESLRKIDDWEKSLIPLLPLFPAPLQDSLREPIGRVEASLENSQEDPRPLQERMRDVVLILQGFREFQNTITVEKELLSLGNSEPREVDVLYLGLNRAFFVDANNTMSGHGRPTSNGWSWTEDSSIATRVREAIEMRGNRIPPAFLSLPFSADKEEAP